MMVVSTDLSNDVIEIVDCTSETLRFSDSDDRIGGRLSLTHKNESGPFSVVLYLNTLPNEISHAGRVAPAL